MAIDDISFITITGEEITRGYLVDQMIGFYNLLLEAGETRVTDFNEGSEVRNLLESIAVDSYIILENKNELSTIGFIETADGEWLDKHGANPAIALARDTGMEATGTVTFAVETPVTTDTVIPEETIIVNSATGLEYATIADAILGAGETAVEVSIECLTTGEDGNCGIGEIDTIDDIIADIPALTVTNENPITGGTDYEEDEEYRQRLLDYKKRDSFGSIPYYISLADNIDGVHDIALDGNPNDICTVIVNGTAKPTPVSVLSDVLEVYTDTNNKVMGHTFDVSAPDYIPINVNVTLGVTATVDETTVGTLITEMVNGGQSLGVEYEFEGLTMGYDLTSEMITSNLVLLGGINTATVTMDIVNGETGLTTIEVGDTESISIQQINITQNTGE